MANEFTLKLEGSTAWSINFPCSEEYAVDRAINILHQIYGNMGSTIITSGKKANGRIPIQVKLIADRYTWYLYDDPQNQNE